MIPAGRLGARAVIAGAGIAGIAAAATLASFFETEDVFDKDELPGEPRPRKGVPQDMQVHILLKGGELALESSIPGTRAALLAGGGAPSRGAAPALRNRQSVETGFGGAQWTGGTARCPRDGTGRSTVA